MGIDFGTWDLAGGAGSGWATGDFPAGVIAGVVAGWAAEIAAGELAAVDDCTAGDFTAGDCTAGDLAVADFTGGVDAVGRGIEPLDDGARNTAWHLGQE
ncbi:MAG: hypothetical protein ACKO38_12035 [Planctomycetota bacterium]